MTFKKTITLLALLSALVMPAQAADATEATDVANRLLALNNSVIKKFKVQKEKDGALSTDTILQIIRADISPKFNFTRLTMRAMGKHWRRTDDDTRAQLTGAFQGLMEKTYSKVLEKYNDEKIKLLEARALSSGDSVSVLMEVSGNGKKVQIDYILSPDSAGEYRIVDIKVEKISLLANYRRQFAQIIRKSKVEGLLAELQKQSAGN